jgi:CBS domain-containing protein
MQEHRPEKVKEAMTQQVIAINKSTSVRDIARLLTENHIRSLPVIDEQGQRVGLVTESDLFLKEKGIPFSADDTLEHAAWVLFYNSLRVLPVTKNKKLVGVLTRVNLIRMLARGEQ